MLYLWKKDIKKGTEQEMTMLNNEVDYRRGLIAIICLILPIIMKFTEIDYFFIGWTGMFIGIMFLCYDNKGLYLK